jgi:hypothetical protein
MTLSGVAVLTKPPTRSVVVYLIGLAKAIYNTNISRARFDYGYEYTVADFCIYLLVISNISAKFR